MFFNAAFCCINLGCCSVCVKIVIPNWNQVYRKDSSHYAIAAKSGRWLGVSNPPPTVVFGCQKQRLLLEPPPPVELSWLLHFKWSPPLHTQSLVLPSSTIDTAQSATPLDVPCLLLVHFVVCIVWSLPPFQHLGVLAHSRVHCISGYLMQVLH